MKILIVDDMVENLYMLESLLKGSGYEVASAKNGVEALERLKRDSIDMIISDILMDMQLPNLDGYEATKRIKADERLAKIPVIALTPYAMKGDREKTLEAGCTGYIEKPINLETFIEEIKKYL